MSPAIEYVPKKFSGDSLGVIEKANQICADYKQQGYDLTLRQLFYQFVSRDLLPNTERNYKRLGSIINDARLAGELDWNYILDRTRNVRSPTHWNHPAEIIQSAALGFSMDKWADQDVYVEVWIEKDALVGVLQGVCPREDVSYFSCRGYTSQSEVWGAARRIGRKIKDGRRAVIIHLGDHDPSGIDMTRDIEQRLSMFIAQDVFAQPAGERPEDYVLAVEGELEIQRIALNADQVREYKPPPNPAKLSDSRATAYIQRYGSSSWELDALGPATLAQLVTDTIWSLRDHAKYRARVDHQEAEREILTAAHERWDEVKAFLSEPTE